MTKRAAGRLRYGIRLAMYTWLKPGPYASRLTRMAYERTRVR